MYATFGVKYVDVARFRQCLSYLDTAVPAAPASWLVMASAKILALTYTKNQTLIAAACPPVMRRSSS